MSNSPFQITKTRIQTGFWEGIVTTKDGADHGDPQIEVTIRGEVVRHVTINRDPVERPCWTLRITIPPELLNDGVQTYLIRDAAADETLDSFSVIAGEPVGEDLRAEIDLLRAELDLLKRAFRRLSLED